MPDELGRIGKDNTARRVIPITMRVQHVANGHLEPGRDLRLEPAREVAIDRIAHDDAVWRHQEHRVVVVVLRAVELPGDIDDAARGRLLRCGAGNEAHE